MIIDPKKKATTLATPRYVPEKTESLKMSLAMQEAARRSERQPKLISMTSNAAINRMPGWK